MNGPTWSEIEAVEIMLKAEGLLVPKVSIKESIPQANEYMLRLMARIAAERKQSQAGDQENPSEDPPNDQPPEAMPKKEG